MSIFIPKTGSSLVAFRSSLQNVAANQLRQLFQGRFSYICLDLESHSFHKTYQVTLKDLELSIFEILQGLNQSFTEHIHMRNYVKKIFS